MLFGVINVPRSFQGYINKILAENLNIFVIIYLDNIFFYTKDPGKIHVKAIQQILEVLRKYDLYANLKKCRFYQDEFRFLGFIVSTDQIWRKEERIDIVKKYPEPKSVRDIQVFIGFTNLYQCFIKDFSKIVVPLTAILKTTESSIASAYKVDDNKIVGSRGGIRAVSRLDTLRKKLIKSKSQIKSGHLNNNNNTEKPKFLTSGAKKAFNHLK